jgi:hypothetical protein
MVYSLHWVSISRDGSQRQPSQSTDPKPVGTASTTSNSIETESTLNSQQYLPSKSPEK